MVDFIEKPSYKWMRTGDTPIQEILNMKVSWDCDSQLNGIIGPDNPTWQLLPKGYQREGKVQ